MNSYPTGCKGIIFGKEVARIQVDIIRENLYINQEICGLKSFIPFTRIGNRLLAYLIILNKS
jgi:hypothetical protein